MNNANTSIELMQKVELADTLQSISLPIQITLPEKDGPIHKAAFTATATHLLTGDIRSFGDWLEKKIINRSVMLPGDDIRFKVSGI